MSNYCWEHEIYFKNSEDFQHHIMNDCNQMLTLKNVCTYVTQNGQCCKKNYKTTTALIMHYYREHRLLACTACYKVFCTEADLEDHHHYPSENLRQSKLKIYIIQNESMDINTQLSTGPYKCRYCVKSWPNANARNKHELEQHTAENESEMQTFHLSNPFKRQPEPITEKTNEKAILKSINNSSGNSNIKKNFKLQKSTILVGKSQLTPKHLYKPISVGPGHRGNLKHKHLRH